MRIPREQVYSNIARYANTSSTSIPLCLTELFADPVQAQSGKNGGSPPSVGGSPTRRRSLRLSETAVLSAAWSKSLFQNYIRKRLSYLVETVIPC